jgi:hypothetical protein
MTPLVIDPANVNDAFVNGPGGVLRASDRGMLQITANGGGALQNQGIIEVLDGSTISVAPSALANYSAGVLTGGTYRVISAGALDLESANIQTNGASIELHGANSAFRALAGLSDNAGTLSLVEAASFSPKARSPTAAISTSLRIADFLSSAISPAI